MKTIQELTENDYLNIVQSAVKAPSGHNTQPWLFAKEDDSLCIMPDFNRSLPVADPDHRELYISLGCAAETASIAARFYGYIPHLTFENLNNGNCKLRILLQKAEKAEEPELFSFISSRQTTRSVYDDSPIPDKYLMMLEQTVTEPGIGITFFKGQDEIRKLTPNIIEANTLQFNDPAFKDELIQWMRFSEKEAMQKGDGLYTACNGVPAMGRMAGSFVLKNFVTAKSEEKRLLRQLDKTAAMAMFTAKRNDTEHWIKAGMSFQRFALTSAKLNLSHSYMNMPCQVKSVREKMMNDLGLGNYTPILLIRMGYSKAMPYSFRRNVHHYITL